MLLHEPRRQCGELADQRGTDTVVFYGVFRAVRLTVREQKWRMERRC